MTRKAPRILCALVAAAVGATALGGCGLLPADPPPEQASPPPGAPAVAMVVGRHAGAGDPVLTTGTRPVVDEAIDRQGYLGLVVADGAPSLDRAAAFVRDCNELACRAQIAEQGDGATAAVAQARATEPETDLVAAIRVAARALPPASGPRTLLVVDPGLSTAGPLRFQDRGVLSADPAEIVGFLAGAGELPDLRGISVVFTGIGDTAAPQQAPDGAVRARLRDLWAAVAARGGAASVRFDDTPLPTATATGLPVVTPVPMPPAPRFDGSRAVLPDTTVGFRPGTAELRDPQDARRVLGPLADRVRRESLTATLTGNTSSADTPEVLADLSLRRAETVKTLLVALGVPGERVRTRGAGYVADPPDTEDGRLLPGPAAANRRVVVDLAPTV